MGDEEPAKASKGHFHENRVMHKNIDSISLKLGITPWTATAGESSSGACSLVPYHVHGPKVQYVAADDSRLDDPCSGSSTIRSIPQTLK